MADPYSRSYNPIWNLRDLTGLPLDDSYYAFFLENDIPYQPQAVYHTPTGTPWTNPIELTAAGTLPIDVFFDPTLVYRIEIRHGNTQADALIWLIENYTPVGDGGDIPTSLDISPENQATNPQFSLINFVSPLILTTQDSQTINIAPGWDLVLTGTASNVTVSQVPLNDSVGSINPTNAPYALRLQLTGWTSAYLAQRFDQAGMLWAGKYVSTAVTAKIEGAPQAISAVLVDSNGTSLTNVLSVPAVTSTFEEYLGIGLIPAPSNPDLPPMAWVEYRLALPGSVDIYLTSFAFTAGDENIELPYQQETVERQVDHTFHYYKDQLQQKPIPSYALGWNFGANPCQALGTSVGVSGLGNNTARYIADQTIAFESVGNVMSYAFVPSSGITPSTGTNTQFALIQYLPAVVAQQLLLGNMAVQLRGSATTAINGNVTLWYSTNGALPSVPLSTNHATFFTSLTAGVPTTIASGWNQIGRSNLGPAGFTLNSSSGDAPFSFNGWFDDTDAATATFFAIVIGFNTYTSTNSLQLDYCTLCQGDIATAPVPLNPAQTLQGLQYYYQKSFKPGLVPAQNVGVNNGETIFVQTATSGGGSAIPINFQTSMIGTPSPTLYNPAGANALIRNISESADYGTAGVANVNPNGMYLVGNSNVGSIVGNVIGINWVADARLGQI